MRNSARAVPSRARRVERERPGLFILIRRPSLDAPASYWGSKYLGPHDAKDGGTPFNGKSYWNCRLMEAIPKGRKHSISVRRAPPSAKGFYSDEFRPWFVPRLFAGRGVEGMFGNQELFNDLAADEVALDDLLQRLRRAGVIPRAFGVDHGDGAAGANLQAVGLCTIDAARADQT